ncbi:hypothetical protein [Vibrio antiquarius]|uniref:hypothetical protein n=1 Tax=Vibrio antiquarius (strain Ex25) TaxID=150340 RepID=UPI000940737E|nr:hypothetical protein [Vibrio antiquarius]OKQ17087.1 hypothetical protein H058_19260 [Vibrio antiquarius]
MNIFGCNLEIRSSHDVNYIEFSGESLFVLDEEFNLGCPYGNKGTTIGLKSLDNKQIVLEVSSEDISVKEEQGKYLEKISILLSSILGFRELNPYYGMPFVTLDLHTFFSRKEGPTSGGELNLTDSVKISSTTYVKFSDYDFSSVQETDLLNHYYNGLKAEGEKSKFFHFFLILEILEGSDLYKKNFPDGTLFSEDEKVEIREFSQNFSGPKRAHYLIA